MKKVSISKGNSKMGAIPSVSLPPIVTCPSGAPCAKLCYAAKLCRLRPNVRSAYQNNLDIYNSDPDEYFRQISAAMSMTRYFRFHVAGDFPDSVYFIDMVQACRANSHCKVLCFTKRYDMVNAWLNQHNKPENLQLIFSEWGETPVPNPHNLPTAAVIFKSKAPLENWEICGGKCGMCFLRYWMLGTQARRNNCILSALKEGETMILVAIMLLVVLTIVKCASKNQ